MPTHALAGRLGTRHHHGGVPPDPAAVAPLDFLVARELGLVIRVDRVHVRRVEAERDAQLLLCRVVDQLVDDELGPALSTVGDEAVERLHPLRGLVRILVHLAVMCHR